MAVIVLAALTAMLAAITALPYLPFAHGLVRVCDFPRLQVVALTVLLAVPTAAFLPGLPALLLLVAQAAILAAQAVVCLRFTPLARVQSLPFEGRAGDLSVLRILCANVKMSNDSHHKLVALLREREPDIALLMEVDERWMAAVAPLLEDYPHRIERPQDNSFGLAMLSRLPLRDAELRFLLLPEVPSIRTTVELRDGKTLRLHVLHPEPPVPYADTLGRDGELVLTAREIAGDPMPAIVTGDLNDVAWSRTTRRFQRLSGLLDPRVGRGFFNSFDARFPFLRWPLDHLFHDPRFRLVCLERLPKIGSDHFPMLFELALVETGGAGESPGAPDSDDREEAREVADEARDLDRKPLGTDWED